MSYDLTVLYQYMMFKEQYYSNDITQLCNNVSYRNADALDHLEMIMAQVRLATAQEIFSDMYKLMRMIRKDD
jgi:hypothetical protein